MSEVPRYSLALPRIIWPRPFRGPYVGFPVLWYAFVKFCREYERNDESKSTKAELDCRGTLLMVLWWS